jgi:hypothetical protein
MKGTINCSCGSEAEYIYRDEYYCSECLLKALERDEEINSVEVSYKTYWDKYGNFVGDDCDGDQEVIDKCLDTIPWLVEGGNNRQDN